MNPRMRPDYIDAITKIARLISDGDAPLWLVDRLSASHGSAHKARVVETKRPTRAQMRSELLVIEKVALCLVETLQSPWVQEFLDASPDGPIVEQRIREVEDLADRAAEAQKGPGLATKSGSSRPGPKKPSRMRCRRALYAL